jgi:hypothetical protein
MRSEQQQRIRHVRRYRHPPTTMPRKKYFTLEENACIREIIIN